MASKYKGVGKKRTNWRAQFVRNLICPESGRSKQRVVSTPTVESEEDAAKHYDMCVFQIARSCSRRRKHSLSAQLLFSSRLFSCPPCSCMYKRHGPGHTGFNLGCPSAEDLAPFEGLDLLQTLAALKRMHERVSWSSYRGVTWDKCAGDDALRVHNTIYCIRFVSRQRLERSCCRCRQKWMVYVDVGGKQTTIGRFDDEEEAARTYDRRGCRETRAELPNEIPHFKLI